MPESKAEEVMQRIVALVTDLDTTGASVERGRLYPFEEDEESALSVYMGEKVPVDDPNIAYQDARLVVVVRAHVKESDEQIDTVLNRISAEVYAAMMADLHIGLPAVVQDTVWLGDDDPKLTDLEEGIAIMDIRFGIYYRHNRTDSRL